MTETYFPELPKESLWPMQMVLQNIQADRGWLEKARRDGGYETGWMEVFGAFGQVGQKEAGGGAGSGVEVDIPSEVAKLFKELQGEKENLNIKDSSEKMSYFRTATALLEKLISLKERAQNIHQIGQFYATVLTVMEEMLTVDQIRGVRDRLHVAAGGEIA